MAADVDVEALIGGEEPFRPEMPFAGEEGFVARFFEHFGNSDFFQCHLIGVVDMEKARVVGAIVSHAGEPIRDVHPHGMTAGHDAGAGGRADRGGGVARGETHAGFGQGVDVGRFVKGAAVDPQIRPAEVIDEKEDEIGLGRGFREGE